MGGGGQGHALGIDLGTTYSCVAVRKNDLVEVILNDEGSKTTPSCVAFIQTQTLVGEAALDQTPTTPFLDEFEQKYERFCYQLDDEKKSLPERLSCVVLYEDTEVIAISDKPKSLVIVKDPVNSCLIGNRPFDEKYLELSLDKLPLYQEGYASCSSHAGTGNSAVMRSCV